MLRCARTFAVRACSCATDSSPRCHASPVQRSAGVTTSVEGPLERQHGEGLVEGGRDCLQIVGPHRGDQAVAQLGGVVEGDRRRLVEHACRLADPPTVTDAVAQPLHALDVGLAVAALPSGRPLGPEHAVAVLPFAQRVRRDARPARESRDVEERRRHWTIPGHRSTVQSTCPKAMPSTVLPCGSRLSSAVGSRPARLIRAVVPPASRTRSTACGWKAWRRSGSTSCCASRAGWRCAAIYA